MFFLFGGLNQRVDDVSQNMKGLVDVAALPQPLPFHISMLDSFAACQVHDVELGFLDLDHFVLFDLRLYQDGEDDM